MTCTAARQDQQEAAPASNHTVQLMVALDDPRGEVACSADARQYPRCRFITPYGTCQVVHSTDVSEGGCGAAVMPGSLSDVAACMLHRLSITLQLRPDVNLVL